jgi:hypothetical protein
MSERPTLFIIYLTDFLKIIIRIAALSRKNKGKKGANKKRTVTFLNRPFSVSQEI